MPVSLISVLLWLPFPLLYYFDVKDCFFLIFSFQPDIEDLPISINKEKYLCSILVDGN